MRKLITALCLILGLSLTLMADWQSDLDQVIKSDNPAETDELIASVVSADPDWWEVKAYLENIEFEPAEKGDFFLREIECADGKMRPYVLYVPETYDPKEPTPLFVILHGGVSRSEIFSTQLDYARDHEFGIIARDNGWLALWPFGQMGATWWDEVGMANIENQIHTVKREYNVDDNRVYLGGFSDGASASFSHAMLKASDYAAFIALNGHMGVAGMAGDYHLYPINLRNRPIYAVTTDEDELYPTRTMKPTIELALSAGADILYHEFEGTHNIDDYEKEVLPIIDRFLSTHVRDPYPTELIWETADTNYGQLMWLDIKETFMGENPDWHEVYNIEMTDERIVIGFMPLWEYEGEGVAVDQVVDEETFAASAGLESGDIIIQANQADIVKMEDLDNFKRTVNRGDSVNLIVLRNGEEVELSGQLPEIDHFPLFDYKRESGLTRAKAVANRIEIETSRVLRLGIRVNPELFNPDHKITIVVDGQTRYDQVVEPDLDFMLRNFLENRDRSQIYIADVEIIVVE
ncbi:MAG: PDZ domain-containing protein [candidate division Zixibacteria bacterium]|nr:PDZ domain-containing protein [candidate division Zixibacteria bacterium]